MTTTPVQLISVPQYRIGQELAITLNGVQHHCANHSFDPKKLEMPQEKLNSFFKRTLPYNQSAKDISLVMLGLQLSKQARATTGETLYPTQISKQATLDNAVDRTIEHVKHGLRDGVQSILESDKTDKASRFLCRMALANHLHGGKISFSSSKQSEFVNKALCRLRQDPDGVHLIMDEPTMDKAVGEELKTLGKDSAVSEYLDQLYQIVTNLGMASTFKGDALEPLVRRSLQRFNGRRFRYAGSLAIKFYSSSVPQKTHKVNETSSDIRGCFLQKDGTTLNSTLANIRRDFVASGTPSNLRGILRIYLEFPDVQYRMPGTHVFTSPVTGDQDVMVYINLSNMDDFFFEDISEYNDDMIRLKKVIGLVCQK
ncbi:hypothetical protein BGW39_006715 [Mortierella sp. 14UC]|nr:hypothetical protein BGW39_006715 [Mortierella sp. 14UC]